MNDLTTGDRFDPTVIHVEQFVDVITSYLTSVLGREPDALWVAGIEQKTEHIAPSLMWDAQRFMDAALRPSLKGIGRRGWKNRKDDPDSRNTGFSQSKLLLSRWEVPRDQIVGGDEPGSFANKGYSSWPYYSAALLLVVERARSKRMKCMSCQNELRPDGTKIFNKILVCSQCYALAEKAEREITQHIERAKVMSMNWLEQHILQGGLLRGGSGDGATQAAGLPVRVQAEVPVVRGAEGAQAPSLPMADRE